MARAAIILAATLAASCAQEGSRYWTTDCEWCDLDACDLAAELATYSYARATGGSAMTLLDRFAAERPDLIAKRAPWESAWGTVAGLYSPPRTVRATIYEGACIADGGLPHEALHVAMWLDGEATDTQHERDEVWVESDDRTHEALYAARAGCP